MFCKKCGCFIPAIISIILGIVVGYLVFNFVILGLVIAIWIALGISVLAILLVLYTTNKAQGKEEMCVCKYGSCIIIGAIFTLICSMMALSIQIIIGVLPIAILIGLSTLFLTFTIFSIAEFLFCLVKANCKCRD